MTAGRVPSAKTAHRRQRSLSQAADKTWPDFYAPIVIHPEQEAAVARLLARHAADDLAPMLDVAGAVA